MGNKLKNENYLTFCAKLIQATPFKSDEPLAHQSFFIHLKNISANFSFSKCKEIGVHYDNKEAYIYRLQTLLHHL